MFLNCITSGWSIFPPQVSQNSKASFSMRGVRWKARTLVEGRRGVPPLLQLCSPRSVGTGSQLHDRMEKRGNQGKRTNSPRTQIHRPGAET